MEKLRLSSPTLRERVQGRLGTVPARARRARWTRSPPYEGFSEPFNAQRGRLEIVEQLRREFEPEACIETGTFLGHTTRYLATWGVPVFSVEIDPAWYRLAAAALKRRSNICLICGDSRDAIRLLTRRRDFDRPFVYLDAHAIQASDGLEDHPLAEELRLILGAWDSAIVCIDDFLVPGQPGYRYDVVEGIPLSSEPLDLPEGTRLAYPVIPPPEETGARRGSAFVAHGADARVAVDRLIENGLLRL